MSQRETVFSHVEYLSMLNPPKHVARRSEKQIQVTVKAQSSGSVGRACGTSSTAAAMTQSSSAGIFFDGGRKKFSSTTTTTASPLSQTSTTPSQRRERNGGVYNVEALRREAAKKPRSFTSVSNTPAMPKQTPQKIRTFYQNLSSLSDVKADKAQTPIVPATRTAVAYYLSSKNVTRAFQQDTYLKLNSTATSMGFHNHSSSFQPVTQSTTTNEHNHTRESHTAVNFNQPQAPINYRRIHVNRVGINSQQKGAPAFYFA